MDGTIWVRKLGWYGEQKILPPERGRSDGETLIVSQDDVSGEISSKEIKQLIEATL